MANISVKADFQQAIKGLKRYQHRHIPYATGSALNKTAFDVKRALIKEWHRSFDVKNKQLPKTIFRVENARWKPPIKLEAAVFDRLNRHFLPLQIAGGSKTPHRSADIAIPSADLKRTTGGKLRKLTKVQTRDSWVGNPTGRGRGVFQSLKGGGYKLLFSLRPSVPIQATYNMPAISRRTVKRRFFKHLRIQLRSALRTAK